MNGQRDEMCSAVVVDSEKVAADPLNEMHVADQLSFC